MERNTRILFFFMRVKITEFSSSPNKEVDERSPFDLRESITIFGPNQKHENEKIIRNSGLLDCGFGKRSN